MKKLPLLPIQAYAGLLGLCLAGTAIAQTAQPNWDYRFRSEARIDDNANLDSNDDPGDTAYFWINTFGLANRVNTRTSSFSLDASGHIRVQDFSAQSETVKFDDPDVELRYNTQGGDDSLRFFVGGNVQDIAFVDTLRGRPISSNDLDFDDTRGNGRRELLNASLAGTINEDAPISFAYDFAAFRRRFVDTDEENSDLNSRTEYDASVTTFFDITRTVRGVVDLGYDFRDVDDTAQTVRRRGRATAGADILFDRVSSFSFRLGYSEVRTKSQRFDTESTETGTIGSVGYNRILRDGTFAINYSVTLDENGQRDRLTVGRTVDRDDITYGGNIGITARSFSDDLRPIGTLFIETSLPRGSLRATLSQNVATDDNSRDTVFTRLGLDWEQNLTTRWNFFLNLNAGRRFEENTSNEETLRYNARAGLRAEITSQWDVDFGYRLRIREDQDDGTRSSSNAIFAALVRPLQID